MKPSIGVRLRISIGALVVTCGQWVAGISAVYAEVDEVIGMSLEELMEVEIYSASKKLEKASDVAAAVYVISSEDIRRSTANSVPDLLRVVPGLQVAKVSASAWSISARGFNSRYSNKLLVLIDGRTVYNPIFSGVYWNAQDIMLEDIERIEVIRGPGGALWGANAVNGIINIITKHAKDTNGVLFSGGGGTEEKGFGSIRYGESVPNGDWRIWAKYYSRDDSEYPGGTSSYDATEGLQSGFRGDFELSKKDKVTIDAGISTTNERSEVGFPDLAMPAGTSARRSRVDHNEGHVTGRWERSYSEDESIAAQAYFQRLDRISAVSDLTVETVDIDLQHRFNLTDSHAFNWGFGFRTTDDVVYSKGLAFEGNPESTSTQVYNAYLQDDISITDTWRLVVGAKLSHNDYSDFEFQPNVRTLYDINDSNLIWAAVSRAVRTPSRAEVNLEGLVTVMPSQVGPVASSLVKSSNFEAEELIAYELGYRTAPHRSLQFDFSLFYFDYDELGEVSPAGPPSVGMAPSGTFLSVPIFFQNQLEGESYGGEVVANAKLTDWFRLQSSYSFLKLNLRNKVLGVTTSDTGLILQERDNPEHQATLRTIIDLPWDLEFDAFVRYVDRLENLAIDSYTELDIRLAWLVNDDVTIALIANNLLDSSVNETDTTFPGETDVLQERGVFGKVTIDLG